MQRDQIVRRRRWAPLVVAAIIASLLLPAELAAQPTRPWPDGFWEGTFTGAGAGSGATTDGSGAGEISSTGSFALTIVDGSGEGAYNYEWVGRGSGQNNRGVTATGSLDVSEAGTFIATGDTATLRRTTGAGSVHADGFGTVAAGPLRPVDTPVTLTFIGCHIVEGQFEQNLAGIDEALGLVFRTSIATETFVAFPIAVPGDTTRFDTEVLRVVNTNLDALIDVAAVAETPDEINHVLDQAFTAVSNLDGLDWERDLSGDTTCSGLDFRLGLADRLTDVVLGLLRLDELALDVLEDLSELALRGGVGGDPDIRDILAGHLSEHRARTVDPGDLLRLDVLDAIWSGSE